MSASDVSEIQLAGNLAEMPPAERLRKTAVAVQVHQRQWGISKTLKGDEKREIAEVFAAQGAMLRAGKKLIDGKTPAWKKVRSAFGEVSRYWKAITLPYVEDGTRLLRRSDVEAFDAQMQDLAREVRDAARELQDRFASIKAESESKLGRLFNADDYPSEVVDLFAVTWEFVNVEPPAYLRDISPELYQQECRRVQQRFESSIRMAEEMFAEELLSLTSHVAERLSGGESGEPKVFRGSTILNLREFFDRFRHLNFTNNHKLNEAVEEAERLLGPATTAQTLREDTALRGRVAEGMANLSSAIESQLVMPTRRRLNVNRTPERSAS